MLTVAREEAPGSVGYFAHLLAIPPLEEEITVTGQCQTDLATLEGIVAEGVPMIELPLNKATRTLSLFGSINF